MLTTGRIALLVAAAAVAFVAWRIASPAEQARDEAAAGLTQTLQQPGTARLTVAATNLQIQYGSTGSYDGASLPAGTTLVRVNPTGYCVQLTGPGQVMHLTGPNGVPAAGPC